MTKIDSLKVAKLLNFDVRCVKFRDNTIASRMVIDETKNMLYSYNSNKIIGYNTMIDENEKLLTIEHQIMTYLKYKTNNKLVLIESDRIGSTKRKKINEEILSPLLLQHKYIPNKNKMKTLYK